jgi:hypothetical protein
MKKIVRLTESDLARIVKRVVSEQILNESGSRQPENSQIIGNELYRKGYEEGKWKKIKTGGTLNIYYTDKKTNQPVFYKSIDTGWGSEIDRMIPKINQVGTWELDGTNDLTINY